GMLLAFDLVWVQDLFAGTDPAVAISPDLPKMPAVHAALIPEYAGPVAFDARQSSAWVGSRTRNTLTAVRLDRSTGVLTCAERAGDKDCRRGSVNTLTTVNLEGPYGVAAGEAQLPGDATVQKVVFVASLVPHIDSI